jgi:1,2-diacylglycerol 3-alpha-glucosyltransferase
MTEQVRVLISCTGVGIFNRGIETFFREAFDGLRETADIDLVLIKGRGSPQSREEVAWCLPRTGRIAALIGRIFGRTAYAVEQWSSLPAVATLIRKHRPHVIYYSEANLGFLLHRFRRVIGVPYRLLYSNGGPIRAPYHRVDFVHQVAPQYFDEAVRAGVSPETQFLVPYGFSLPDSAPNRDPTKRKAIRAALDVPTDRPVVLSVGWIARRHKRMDYVIEELARLPAPRPFLVLLGAMDDQSEEILTLARDLLGVENFTARSVGPSEVAAYYAAADLFVLASLEEGFGRVYVEALASGLPVVAHDYPVARFVLADQGVYADLSEPGSLAAVLAETPWANPDQTAVSKRWASAYDRFSWPSLRARYRDMFLAAAGRDVKEAPQ